jgi:hypothetical protein
MHRKLVAWMAAVTATMGSLHGCAGSLDDPGAFETGSPTSDASTGSGGADTGAGGADSGGATPACAAMVPTTILQQTCGLVGCHNPASPAEGLDLYSPGVASRLIGVPEGEEPALGLLLIDPANPQNSVILTKLQASTVPFGEPMPLGETPLSSQQIACVAAWIDSVVSSADAGQESSSGPGSDASARK